MQSTQEQTLLPYSLSATRDLGAAALAGGTEIGEQREGMAGKRCQKQGVRRFGMWG